MKQAITTSQAPAAIGTYSQAIRAGDTLYISGQIPLDPNSMDVVNGDISAHIHQCFTNLKRICEASGVTMDAIVKLTIYLTDLDHFPVLNEVMANYFKEPYPARAAVEVSALPKGVGVEMDAIAYLA